MSSKSSDSASDLSPQQRKQLEQWLSEDPQLSTDRQALMDIWSVSQAYGQETDVNTAAAWQQFQQSAGWQAAKPSATNRRRRISRFVAAAAVLLLFIGGWWMLRPVPSITTSPLVYEATEGQPQDVRLADGTRVLLDSNSRLETLTDLSGGMTRAVRLSGQAYFEVMPDAKRPFQVTTAHSLTSVLGTAFNLQARPDDFFTELSVTEGRVAFEDLRRQERRILTAGQSLRIDARSGFVEASGSVANTLSWYNRELKFKATPLPRALADAARFYSIKIDQKALVVGDCPLTGDFTDQELEQLFAVLELVYQIKVHRTSSDTYRLSGGVCQSDED